MVDKLEKILFVSIMSLTLLGFVSAADWEFNPLDEPYNQHELSVNTSTVFLTHLETNEGDRISPDDIAGFEEGRYNMSSLPYVFFEYEAWNDSSEETFTVNKSLSYHDNLDVWYAEFKPNYTDMTELTFRAQGDLNSSMSNVDSNGEASNTVNVEVSDVNTTLLRDNLELDFSQAVKAAREDKFDVRTLNISNGATLDQNDAEVDVYFHDLDGVDSSYSLDNYNDNPIEDGGQYHFNAEVSTPEATDSPFVLRINSTTSQGVKSSESFFIDTAAAIEGEVSDLSSEGCSSTVQECEPEAEIDSEFNIVAASAEAVNMTIYAINRSSGDAENLSTVQMDQIEASDGVEQAFEGSIELPDINTSAYEKDLELEFHAWNNERSYSESHDIDLRNFKIQDRSNPTAFKGRSHQVRLLFGKYFSLNPYDHDRFDSIEVNITGENFNQAYTGDDFEYREADGVMVKDIVIPEDEASGTYDLDISATNIYNETKEFSSGLKVRDVNATFAAESDLEFGYNELGVFSENVTLENLADSDKTIDITTDLGILDIAESVTLEPSQERELSFDIDLSEAEDYEGEITFSDSTANYNETTAISVEGPQCQIKDSNLCVSQDSMTLDTDERASVVTETLAITNLGSEDLELETEVTGNISDHISVVQNLTVESSDVLEITFETENPGDYQGHLEITGNDSEASVNLSSNADFEVSEPELTVSPSTIDLNTVADGESSSEEVTIQNTGEITIEDIQVTSDAYNFSIDSFSLGSGEENTVELELENVQESMVIFTGNAAGNEVTAEVSIEADIIEDYSERTDELRDRVSELRSRSTSTETDTDLTEVSAMVDQVGAQWDSGDYEQARTTFEDAQSELNTIEAEIESQESESPGGENPGSGDEEEGGGFPILPLMMIFFVFAAIGGFVFYESYIPEEGDPLYGVLGE